MWNDNSLRRTGELPMSTKYQRIAVFDDTKRLYSTDADLIAAINNSKRKTEVFYENQYPEYEPHRFDRTDIVVSGKRSFEAAMELKKENPDSKIAVLNFANAFHPGGGVVNGASAQEECLCRCSTLYPLLYRRTLRDQFYSYHEKINDPKATDALIYTEEVVIFKTDTDLPTLMPKEDWITVDVITCAAPDLRTKGNTYFEVTNGGADMRSAELFGYHVRRAIHILTAAAHKRADTVILGAFGCGAFQNDPKVVARAYKTALQEFSGTFRKIEFAVYCPPQGTTENYEAFDEVFR